MAQVSASSPSCNYPPPMPQPLRDAALGAYFQRAGGRLCLNESRYFASGTGGAGLVGAFLWWELRHFGVRVGVGLSSVRVSRLLLTFSNHCRHEVLPFTIPLAYFFLLPQPSSIPKQDEGDDDAEPFMASSTEYTPLPTDEGEDGTPGYHRSRIVALSASDKWRLVKPIIPRYMLPLCECPPWCMRLGLLTQIPVKFACIWLVDILENLSPTCSPICFLVRVYDQPGPFTYLSFLQT